MHRLDVIIHEIAVPALDYRIQPYPFGHYRSLDVFTVHDGGQPGPVLIPSFPEFEGVMLHRFPFGNSVCRCEFLLRHKAGVVPEGVNQRKIALDEHFQCGPVDKAGGVRYDGIEEAPVVLIAAQLGLPVLLYGDYYRVQTDRIAEHVHIRIQPELPVAVLHVRRNYHLEFKVHPAMPLGHIAEAGGNHSRREPVVSDHIPVLIAYCIHYQGFPPLEIDYSQGVPGDIIDRCAKAAGCPGGWQHKPRPDFSGPDMVQLVLGAA